MNVKIVAGPTGAQTKLFLNGEPYGRCTALKYEVQAGGIAKLTLEIFPESVEIEGDLPVEMVPKDLGNRKRVKKNKG